MKVTKKQVAVFWGVALSAKGVGKEGALGLVTFRTRDEARKNAKFITDGTSTKASRPFKIYVEM